jgi:ribose transport system permease protein
MKWIFQQKNVKFFILLFISLLLSILNKDFFSLSNFVNILRQASILAILGIGVTFVIITAGIDLSLAGVMSLSGCFCAILLNRGLPVPVAIIFTFLGGVFFGFVNGSLVSVVGLPPFVATYGVKFIADGLALILMGGNILFGFPKSFIFLGIGFVFKTIPILVVVSAALIVVFHIILSRSRLGKEVFCVGANISTSYYSGIKTKGILLFVYILSSFFASVAGILLAARMSAAQAGMGESYQMLAIASVVIGGTSMAGGEGDILGTIVGALILTLIVNGMNLLGMPTNAQPLITGLVIILAVLMDVQIKKVKFVPKTILQEMEGSGR